MSSPGFVPVRGPLPPDDVLRSRVKAAIRKRLRGLRKTTPSAACAERSSRIVALLAGLDVMRGARRVALFWPIEDKHEVDLRALDASLRARGARVAYPTVLESGEGGEMIFRFVDDLVTMQDHPLGFRAPGDESPRAEELDVIVVPAIALDPTGQRIGYGAGFYDRALGAHARAVTVGVAYDFQLIPEVAATSLDVPVHWIVTDRRALRASADAALTAAPTAGPEPRGT
jgi:5-formyltetrahydrofolate cyclo-ligase